MTETNRRPGRPRKDPDEAVRHGIMLQPKFCRQVYAQIKAAAAAEGLSATGWVRHLVFIELARGKESHS
jgi:hypothetical protein